MQRISDPTLAEFYRGWFKYQELIARAIAPLDHAHLGLSAAPHLWSLRMLASHVVSVREWWFHSWMGEGGSVLAKYSDWDEKPETATRSAQDLVRGLDETWSMVASCLERWTAADLGVEFTRPVPNSAGERPVRTRQYIVWHVAEHDIHHGGEISLTLGMHGLRGLEV